MLNVISDVTDQLIEKRFAFVTGDKFQLNGNFTDFSKLTRSWEEMEKDVYYGNEEKATRFRRYSDFSYNPNTNDLIQHKHKSYFQSLENNEYVGGQTRHFADFADDIMHSDLVKSLVKDDFEIYMKTLPEEVRTEIWQCQIHQIRIEINPGQEVEITPEKIHCDGYPFSAVHFWGRNNVTGAESKLYTKENQEEILSGTFENILDTIYFFDREMLHYVTPAKNETNELAYRQIIAISFSLPGTEYDTIR